MTDTDRVIAICSAWVTDGLGDECFWEGWPDEPDCEKLTPNMVLDALRAMQVDRDQWRVDCEEFRRDKEDAEAKLKRAEVLADAASEACKAMIDKLQSAEAKLAEVEKERDNYAKAWGEACSDAMKADARAEAAVAQVEVFREGLQQAYESLLWCAREGRMASPSLHQYPAKWAAEAFAVLTMEAPNG